MNGVLLINKPKGMTSFDVCRKVKKVLNEPAVGHTGTLDPEAEGLLIVLLGKACKCLPYLNHDKKEYIATIELGKKYDTADVFGNVIEKKEIKNFSEQQFNSVLASFIGHQKQIPPMMSAIKVNGKKLYEYFREGKVIEREPRDIYVNELICLDFSQLKIKATVSKGTYIRTLIEDICQKLDNLGSMSSLCRTSIGEFNLSEAVKLAELSQDVKLYSTYDLLGKMHEMIEIQDVDWVKQGKKLHLNSLAKLVVVHHQQEVLAVYEKIDDYMYKCKRGLF